MGFLGESRKKLKLTGNSFLVIGTQCAKPHEVYFITQLIFSKMFINHHEEAVSKTHSRLFTYKRIKLNPFFTLYRKTNAKWIIDLNVNENY